MPAAKRRAVAHLKEAFGMSERRACKVYKLLFDLMDGRNWLVDVHASS